MTGFIIQWSLDMKKKGHRELLSYEMPISIRIYLSYDGLKCELHLQTGHYFLGRLDLSH